MIECNFITTNKLEDINGGGSGVNFNIFNILKSAYLTNYIRLENTDPDIVEKLISKTLRLAGLKGNYFFFSNRRLAKISKFVAQKRSASANFNFYNGPTSWIQTTNDIPYFVYLDACFATYIDIFLNKNQFSNTDLSRIYKEESIFLQKASKVFFRSQWALNETIKVYNLKGSNFEVVGFGGGIEIPERDYYTDGKYFVFISKEFLPKGGAFCVDAFALIADKYPDFELYIVGDKPPEKFVQHSRVKYLGFINKNSESGKAEYAKILTNAYCIIHPTFKDTNSLVITEAAYFGCPAIASNSFAIPGYVKDGENGFLINTPITSKEIASKMEYLIQNKIEYFKMRMNARKRILKTNTWAIVNEKITKSINRVLNEG